jgi:SAM-dependent methyltransferase
VVERFAIEGLSAPVVVCPKCGIGWIDPQPGADEIAGFYPREYYGDDGSKFAGLLERVVRLLAARQARFLSKRAPRGARVLDLGCGRGTLLRQLADDGFEVHGTEISEHAALGADPRVQLRVASTLSEAGYSSGFFDQVILWHVLEHLADPLETLCEIRRILKPGGEIVVAVPNFSSWQARWSGPAWFHLDLPRHLYHFPLPGLKRLLETCGFQCVAEHHFSLRQNPIGWIQSALNRTHGIPRNSLYGLLYHRSKSHRARFGPVTRAVSYAAAAVGGPAAILLEVLASLAGQGGTVHVVAR